MIDDANAVSRSQVKRTTYTFSSFLWCNMEYVTYHFSYIISIHSLPLGFCFLLGIAHVYLILFSVCSSCLFCDLSQQASVFSASLLL